MLTWLLWFGWALAQDVPPTPSTAPPSTAPPAAPAPAAPTVPTPEPVPAPAPAAPVPAPVVQTVYVQAPAPPPNPKCLTLRFATTGEVEKRLKELQDAGHTRFVFLDDRMVCGWQSP